MNTLINNKIILFFILILKFNYSYSQNIGTYLSYNETIPLLAQADSLFRASNYEAAIKSYKMLSETYFKNEQWEDLAKIYFRIANSYQVRGLFDSSFYFLKISDKLIHRHNLNNENLMANYFYIKGSTQNKIGLTDSALISLDLSLKYLDKGVDDSLQVLVKRTIGNIYLTRGKFVLSLKFYNDALRLEKLRLRPSEIMQAALFQNIGIVYTSTGNYDSARVYLNESISLKEKTLNKTDPQLAIGYLNYGRFLYVLGNPDQALDYYSRAEDIYYSTFGKEYFGLAPIYFNKGSIYILLRDLNKALTYSEKALELYLNTVNQTNPIIGDLYMNLGLIFEEKGDIKKAIQYYNESLIGNFNSESKVKSLKSLARCYFILNDTATAEEKFKLSISEAESLLGPKNYITAGSYLTYGDFCIAIKNFKKAEQLLQKALDIRLNCFGNKNRDVSLVLASLGDLYRNNNEYDKALLYYQKSIISNCDNFNNENIDFNPAIEEIDPEFNKFVTFYKKAYTLYDLYNEKSKNTHYLEISLATSKLSIALFESILASFKDENTKIMTNEYVHDIYNLVVLVASELFSKSNNPKYLKIAFEYSEKGRAAILLSSIRGYEAIEFGNIPLNVKTKEESLKHDIVVLKNFIYDERQMIDPDSSKLIAWEKEVFSKTLSYDSLISTIEREYPEYYNLKYKIDVADVNEIQKNLRSDEIFIEYKMIDSLLYTFSITREKLTLNKEILENDFREKILDFISSINQFPVESFNKENYLEFIYKGNDIYRTLLNPIIQTSNYSKIIIIPDNILGYLPFEALIKEYYVPDKIDFKNLNYLIKSSSVSYAYSGTLLYKNLNQNSAMIKLLAMAPIYNNKSAKLKESNTNVRDIADLLQTLDNSVEEVSKIGSLIPGKELIGANATESNFKKYAEDYGILHFAMHTLIDDQDPMASKLIFTLNNDTAEDGLLNAYEIYNLKLKASLAVLSACKTGIGKFSKGEGIMSLARGFLYAGVPSIVMTLWEVEDVAGSEIMYSFYKNLKRGMETDNALREAKLSYLESADPLQSHPYFWAAYVQIGKTKPIITLTNLKKTIVLSISAVVILILLLLLLGKIRKKEL